jgi:hypothetical protein
LLVEQVVLGLGEGALVDRARADVFGHAPVRRDGATRDERPHGVALRAARDEAVPALRADGRAHALDDGRRDDQVEPEPRRDLAPARALDEAVLAPVAIGERLPVRRVDDRV